MIVKLKMYMKQGETDFYIEEYDKLPAGTMQALEDFSGKRGGYFRHDLKRFSLRKKASVEFFTTLFAYSGLTVQISEPYGGENKSKKVPAGASNIACPYECDMIIGFGKYKGYRWGDLPDDYLMWMQSALAGKDAGKVSQKILQYRKDLQRASQADDAGESFPRSL